MKHPAILVLFCLPVCSAYPLNGAVREKDPSTHLVQQYLENYYDLSKDVKQFVRRRHSGPVVKKIREMQKFLGLEVTGKLDPDTLAMVCRPRCGVPDVGQFTTFPGLPKWRKTHLTYRIVNYTLDLPREAVDSAFEKALKAWEEVTPLTFSKIYEGEADIMIFFAVREHGDFIPFDGSGNILAHAYPPGPGLDGDVHFDDDELWREDKSGTNLFLVAAHELGHSLGLYHSADPTALMYPVYNPRTDLTRFRLAQDDVNGIQSLYGNHFWAIRGTEVQAGYPKDIHTLGFPPALGKIDAAVSDEEKKKTYFFVEDKYWRFDENSQSMEQGFPRLIADDFPGVGPKVDAVFQEFGFFYFFRGPLQFEFDPNARMVTRVLKSNNWLYC